MHPGDWTSRPSHASLTIGQNLDGLRKLGLDAAQMTAITRNNAVRLLPQLQG